MQGNLSDDEGERCATSLNGCRAGTPDIEEL
jgi:hypothetical protein